MAAKFAKLVIDGKTVLAEVPSQKKNQGDSSDERLHASQVHGWRQLVSDADAIFGERLQAWKPMDLPRMDTADIDPRTMISNVYRQVEQIKFLVGTKGRGTVFDNVSRLTASLLGTHPSSVKRHCHDDLRNEPCVAVDRRPVRPTPSVTDS